MKGASMPCPFLVVGKVVGVNGWDGYHVHVEGCFGEEMRLFYRKSSPPYPLQNAAPVSNDVYT